VTIFFTNGFQGHAFGAPARDGLAALRAQPPGPPAGLIRRNVPPKAAEVAGDPVAAGRARFAAPSSGSPRRGGGPRIAAPHRPQAVQAAAPVAAAARGDGRPPRAGHPVAAQRSPSRALAALASFGRRFAPALDRDLPRQDLGTYQEDGGGIGSSKVTNKLE
jgi:hypothetical protein